MLCSNEKLPTRVFNKDPTEAERDSMGGGGGGENENEKQQGHQRRGEDR